ncbi:lipoprotein insertase outer membrane protein LolB [Thioalkalivibrio sp. HK1]|uniref:lipoprotein insertase outer membrane protein LolB n=1 Tax=Thioalkalivibrio sp. HK1 TaxID=1469245 RepID=UPI001E53AABA|nr:lipoprotein insertase outer membrane protein LolB [Thioalkalivibrio sp. HK1]
MLSLSIIGCASSPPEPMALAPAASSPIDTWTLRAGLVVRTAQRASRATVLWRQNPANYTLRFTGLLGTGLFEVRGSESGEVEARFADGRRRQAQSPDRLLESEIGWSAPFSDLRYWIVGAVSPQADPAAEILLDAEGRVVSLKQSGWTVRYENYQLSGSLSLPERIHFSKGEVSAEVRVHAWTLKV